MIELSETVYVAPNSFTVRVEYMRAVNMHIYARTLFCVAVTANVVSLLNN